MILTITFIVLLIIGLPLYVCLGLVSLIFFWHQGIPTHFLVRGLYSGADQYPLIAVTGFLLVGNLFEVSGITESLVNLIKKFMQSFKAGLAVITIVACAVFAAVSGSGPATVATIGGIMVPAMLRFGYSARFAGAVSASGGALGILIPPSNPFLVYGIIASQSIAGLFLAGLMPGILMAVALSITASLLLTKFKKNSSIISNSEETDLGKSGRLSIAEILRAVYEAKWSLFAIVLLLGGIYAGFFTPIEAAEVTVVYTLLVGIFITKKLKVRDIYIALARTLKLTGTIIIIVAAAAAFAKLLTIMQVPQKLGVSIAKISENPHVILMIIMAIMIFIGMWMETFSQIIIMTPIFLPVVTALGVNPIHFGVLFVVTAEIGFLTPPVGGNLWVAMKISGTSLEELSKATIPFVLTYILVLLLLIYVPEISLFLPRLVFGI